MSETELEGPSRRELERQWLRAKLAAAIVVFGLAAAVVGWSWVTLQDPAKVPLQLVRIEGELRYVDHDVLRAELNHAIEGQSFFSVNLRAVQRAAEATPWVYSANIRRVWPKQLYVRVTEQVPYARWGEAEVLNQHGERFRPGNDKGQAGLPRLFGPDGSEREVMRTFEDVKRRLETLGLKLVRLEMDPRRSWTLYFEGGLVARLGNSDFETRLSRLMLAYPVLVDDGPPLERIDMRYANGVAVKRQVVEEGVGGKG